MNRYNLDANEIDKLFKQLDMTIVTLENISGEWNGDDESEPLGIQATTAMEAIESINEVKETLKDLL